MDRSPVMLPETIAFLHDKPMAIPKSRVELHVHFDGAGRRETLWEAIRSKGGELPGDGSFRAFEAAVEVRKPKDLLHFLKSFGHFCNAYMGDVAVTRRMAVEFCEDQAANGVAYTEARFSPHLMASEEVGAEEMLRAALDGFREGEEKFGTKVG